jgi:hypothetical protein
MRWTEEVGSLHTASGGIFDIRMRHMPHILGAVPRGAMRQNAQRMSEDAETDFLVGPILSGVKTKYSVGGGVGHLMAIALGCSLVMGGALRAQMSQHGDFQIWEEAGHVAIFSYNGTSENVVVPPTINNKPVTAVGSNAFFNNQTVRSISLPPNLERIEAGAFSQCEKLASILIPEGVVFIGDDAFFACTSLQSATIGSQVKSIGRGAFGSCEKLENIVIPDSVESIGSGAFGGCVSLKTADIGDGVTEIGFDAFSVCRALETISIGSKVEKIGHGCFGGCFAIHNITLPENVTVIEEGTFELCTKLETVTISGNLTSIGRSAFLQCFALKNLTLPNTLTFIDYQAFNECYGLRALKFLGNAPQIGGIEILNGADQSTVYYVAGTTGWGPTFDGRPTALWSGNANQVPTITRRLPAGDPAAVVEGASVSFSLTATDATDPEVAERGMVSTTWFVDGVQKQETKTGAPGAIASTFKLKTDANTVQAADFRDVPVRAVALDKQGGTTVVDWTLRVNNLMASQTITFKPLLPAAPGDPDFAPGATASSGLPVEYTSSNPAVAEIVGGMVHLVGAGSTVITAGQPGNTDFKPAKPVNQTLVIKSRVIADVPGGGGTVTGAGLYAPGAKVTLTAKPLRDFTFLQWEDGSQSPKRTLVLNDPVVVVQAVFKRTADIPPTTITDPGAQACMVGVPFQLPLEIDSESLPKVTISGLPAGLKFDPATRTITGVATAPGAGKPIIVTVKNVNKRPAVLPIGITINALPGWAQGNFGGWFENEAFGVGTAALSVTAKGSSSGKLVFGGKTYSFAAPAFAGFDEDLGELRLTSVAKSGATALPLEIVIRDRADNPDLPGGFGKAEVTLADAPDDPSAWLYRNLWKDAGMAATLANYTAYYTASISGDPDSGSGYLMLTADKAGMVKTTGKLGDGTALTSALPLLMDENGRLLTVLNTAPAAYKGGCFFGVAEFMPPEDGAPVAIQSAGWGCLWENRNPAATGDYEAGGFLRNVLIEGGRYNPAVDFRTAYPDGLLCGFVPLPALLLPVRISDFNPESMAENPPIISWNENWQVDATSMSPDGLPITVTPATGIGTGLAAPKPGAPVKFTDPDTREWWYDYDAENSCGLTLSVDRKTGKFKGSFNIYYDYISAENWVNGVQTSTHLTKKVSFEGVLTPVRPAGDDGIAGCGFYLLPDKATYFNQADKEIIYSFTGSHDFQLLDAQ